MILETKRLIIKPWTQMLTAWGKGYATEAAFALSHYLLNTLQYKCIYGFALPQNGSSIRVLEKIGFNFEKEFLWGNLNHKLYKRGV